MSKLVLAISPKILNTYFECGSYHRAPCLEGLCLCYRGKNSYSTKRLDFVHLFDNFVVQELELSRVLCDPNSALPLKSQVEEE